MKQSIVYFSECAFFAGCENMLANFFNDKEFQESYNIMFIYRWSPRYENGFKKRVHNQIETIPLKLYSHYDMYAWADSIPYKIIQNPCKIINAIILPFFIKYVCLLVNTIILFRVIHKKKIDIVHVNNGGYPAAYSTISMVLAARLCNIPRIVYVVNNIAVGYGSLNRCFDYILDQLVVHTVTFFVTGSNYASSILKSTLNIPSNKIQSIPNGIAQRKITETREQLIQRLSLPENRVILSVIANLEERKGHIFLLKSMKFLKETSPNERLPYCVFEGAGPTEEVLKTFVIENGLENDVKFIPYEEHVFNLINASDCIILPSVKGEDFPNIILESMSLGKAIIASNFSGIPEQIEHMKSGILVEPGDPSSLAMAIKFMIDHPEMKKMFGECAKVRFEELFKEKNAIDHYREIYDRITVKIPSRRCVF